MLSYTLFIANGSNTWHEPSVRSLARVKGDSMEALRSECVDCIHNIIHKYSLYTCMIRKKLELLTSKMQEVYCNVING